MKILISAYSCETGRGGEGEIGWQLVNRLAQDHEVWVITRANLRPVHAAAFSVAPKPEGLHIVYYDLPWAFRFYKRGKRFFLLYYYLWQIGLGAVARRLHRRERFDILHHLIGGMDWMPAGLALSPGRFVWGPVGSENTHPALDRHLPLRSRLKDRARLAMRWVMRHLDPFVRLTAARASVILSHTIETMPRRYSAKLRPFVQTGIEGSPALTRPKTNFARSGPLRLIYAGELKDWKGARLALDAALIAFAEGVDGTLTIVGDGPLRVEMEAVARAHPEGGRVQFLGRLSMSDLVNTLHDGDVFLYPSFHHGLATIVLQAMLTGLPVVCIEGDATGRTVGGKAGITVPLAISRAPDRDLATALIGLANDEDRRLHLAVNAQVMAREQFSYEHLASEIEDIYASSAERSF